MIIKEIIYIKDKEYQKTYSDSGFYILNENGIKYVSAVDPQGYYNREYTETNELIPVYPKFKTKNLQSEDT